VLVGSSAELSTALNAYCAKMLGLMAVHLILLGINELDPTLARKVTVYLDCKGALDKVGGLPLGHLPEKCKHSDILKNILVNCAKLSYAVVFEHIEAHQDDRMDFHRLSRPAQLNCAVDAGAKQRLLEADAMELPVRWQFPLEPIVCYVRNKKMIMDMGDAIRFWVHRRLAREALVDGKVLYGRQFNLIAWEAVYAGLHGVPQMFQFWACKQVWDIAGTNSLRSRWDQSIKKWCRSCRRARETAAHIPSCNEVGRVKTLQATIDFVEEWLEEVYTDPMVVTCVVEYARGRGCITMQEICCRMESRYQVMAEDQDTIKWRRFMEGMLSWHLVGLQANHHALTGEGLQPLSWASQLVIRLLEVTHGQWIYCNIQVHDEAQGMLRTQEKERLQRDIEEQMELGFEGFLEMDQPLANIPLEDLECCSGERQEYWLLAVRAARAAKALMSGSAAAVDTHPD
jgi:hypothetical protein